MTTIALKQRSMHQARAINLPKINLKAVYISGIVALFAMLIFYVYSINALTSGSYLIKSYNQEIQVLQVENTNLEASFAASGFMGSLQEKARELSFEKTTQVTYIEVAGASLARAR